ncbi:MAG: tetratricopeptide repeat protein [Herpetosiphonaceae bacterium]|nr:tetratricopeptide repeat protein [Herpetosiphonaceae bacterium]
MTEKLIPSRECPLVGRDALIAELVNQSVVERLLTLTGPGGVGKTSIAQQIATHVRRQPAFADGVRWVDLAALSSEAAVLQAIGQTCGVSERRDEPWLTTLAQALQSSQMLLVLDNCEHLLSVCSAIIAHLIATCPSMHILATSREPLDLPAERRVAIPSLDVAAAVTLFELRATACLRSFAITAANATAVTTICRQLDGIPLAIELAAARVALLSVAQIAERMTQSLSLLAGREADRPLRQRSLRAVLDWSYMLLHADEQLLLNQLAVFVGSFDFDAIEAVCLVAAPLDALGELVNKSLVQATAHPGTVRYRLHEVVRQYASERLLETGTQDEVLTRHLDWAIALAERAEADPDHEDEWLTRLLLEHENIRCALQTADQRGDADSLLRIAGALAKFWNSVSVSEGRTWLARGRALPPVQPGTVSVKAWNIESFLAYRQGDYDTMHAAATEALHEALRIEYAAGIAAARYRLGIHAEMKGNTAEAHEQYQQSLAILQELDDRRAISQVLNGLAHVAKLEGNLGQAQQYYRQGLALARAGNNSLSTALLLISLANLHLYEGDLEAAEASYAESLIHLRAAKNTSYVLYAVNGLGEVAFYRKQFTAAAARHQEGLRLARDLGLKDMETQFLGNLGRCAMEQGDYGTAADYLSQSLRTVLSLERTFRTAAVIHFCAKLVFRLGYPAQATTLFVAGLRAVEAEDFAYLENESADFLATFEAAQAALDATEHSLAVADGELLSLAKAADLALLTVFLPQRQLLAVPPPELRIFLFNRLRVLRDGRELIGDDWVYSKTKDLLLFLLLGESATKFEIGTALWPDASAEQLRQNFRMAIYHLRRALGDAEWITFTNGAYAFNRARNVWIDLVAFESAIEQSRADPNQRTHHLRTASALYTGDLTTGALESDTLLLRREQLHQQALEVLLALGQLYTDSSRHAPATEVYRRVLALDSYNEAAHRGLLLNLARQGAVGAALVHYDHFVELLAQDLGIDPTPETATLAARIKAGVTI